MPPSFDHDSFCSASSERWIWCAFSSTVKSPSNDKLSAAESIVKSRLDWTECTRNMPLHSIGDGGGVAAAAAAGIGVPLLVMPTFDDPASRDASKSEAM